MQVSVKDVVALLPTVEELYIVWDGCAVRYNHLSALDRDAYGDYAVSSICPTDENRVEIVLAAQPVKVCPGARA